MHLRAFTSFTSIALACCLPLIAQERTGTGYTMEWEHVLSEQPDVLSMAGHPLQGWSFVAYETVTSDALGYWRDHMESFGGRAKGKNPASATGATVPGLGAPIPIIYASADKDREEGGVRITVVFALNDSTAAPELPGMAAAVHEMSVAVNRAVVQAQVAEQEKVLKKAVGRQDDAEHDRKLAGRLAGRASNDLEKNQERQAKLLRNKAELEQDAEKLQNQYDSSGDSRTVKKLGKVHEELADVEKDLARMQERTVESQAQAEHISGQVPDTRTDEQSEEQKKERAEKELEALKSKLAAIR